jgi:hypothetical protein
VANIVFIYVSSVWVERACVPEGKHSLIELRAIALTNATSLQQEPNGGDNRHRENGRHHRPSAHRNGYALHEVGAGFVADHDAN